MKVQIRQSVFETNSSSTHTLCFVNKSDWKAWRKGEPNLFFNISTGIVKDDDYKKYYEKYLQKCKEKAVSFLDFEDWMCEYHGYFTNENKYLYYNSMEIIDKDVPGVDDLVAISTYAY